MAITVYTGGSGRDGGVTSHSLGTQTVQDGRMGLFMLLVASYTADQPHVTALDFNGNVCTKIVSNILSGGLTETSFWYFENLTGSDMTGALTATTDITAASVMSQATITGYVPPNTGATFGTGDYRYLYDTESLTPNYAAGVVIGIGGVGWIGVTTTLDGTTIHDLYTYAKPYIGTHYKTYTGGGSTSLNWNWDDAAAYQWWNVLMLEVVEDASTTFSPHVMMF